MICGLNVVSWWDEVGSGAGEREVMRGLGNSCDSIIELCVKFGCSMQRKVTKGFWRLTLLYWNFTATLPLPPSYRAIVSGDQCLDWWKRGRSLPQVHKNNPFQDRRRYGLEIDGATSQFWQWEWVESSNLCALLFSWTKDILVIRMCFLGS